STRDVFTSPAGYANGIAFLRSLTHTCEQIGVKLPADDNFTAIYSACRLASGCYHVRVFDRDRTAHRFPNALTSPLTLWLVSMALGAMCAYLGRFQMNPDGLSYLDIASQTLDRGPVELVSGYWSPGYPALISLSMALFRPTPEAEVPLLHGLNFGIFIL